MSSLLRSPTSRDQSHRWYLKQTVSPIHEDEKTHDLDIVLFGIGDFRVIDHPGLLKARLKGGKVLPLVILDEKDTLPNMPMGRIHTLDTAALLHTAMNSLNAKLISLDKNLKLHVKTGRKGEGVQDLMVQVLNDIRSQDPDVEKISIHVCDLGHVDNQLGYGPLIHVQNMLNVGFAGVGDLIELNQWDCHLRDVAWKDIEEDPTTFPNSFVDYEKKYNLASWNDEETLFDANLHFRKSGSDDDDDDGNIGESFELQSMSYVPPLNVITDLVCSAFDYDTSDTSVRTTLEQDRNTGLYATHWGGLDIPSTFSEDCAMNAIEIFLGGKDAVNMMDGDEALVEQLKWWCRGVEDAKLTRNNLSLEHSALDWMMTGGSDGTEIRTSDKLKAENLIEGELLTRFLAAPLLFGLISPRLLLSKAHAAMRDSNKSFLDTMLPSILKSRQSASVVKTIVEGREWHKLFAYKNSMINSGKDGSLTIGYWRWHGFLCRYVGHLLKDDNTNVMEKQGIALVHGFGASGSQWLKAIEAMQKEVKDQQYIEALAPDLIGFGQSEKPSLTYTQYLWESYTLAFMKDIALGKRNWDSFTIGGNSIGGYTAMGAAADDSVTNANYQAFKVTASGSNGTGKCRGLVLMNSAGKVFKREDIESMKVENGATVAEATANNLLGVASPPPRLVAKVGGTGLLWYLRPRIQSICKNLYPTNPSAVDNILCDGILRDSLDPGAINVMISGSKLPPPRTANELLGADFGSATNRGYISSFQSKFEEGTFDGPVLVAQGLLDPLNDAKGRAEMFGKLRAGIKVDPINGGHCPHDELPSDIAKSILSWLESDVLQESRVTLQT